MEMNFCRRCGAPLTPTNDTSYQCANGHTIFASADPTAGIFILTPDNQVMLSIRGIEPHKGMLDAFGGFVDGAERLEYALERELREELGLEPSDYEPPVFLCSGVGNYEFEGERKSTLGSFFYTRLKPGAIPIPADDVAGIKTVPFDDLDMDLVHDDDVRTGLRALLNVITKEET